MKVLSIRRITADSRHNAFTGACWFKKNLYIAYRQGDDHECNFGRIIVLRSRDKGITWDTVTVLRGRCDTRDAHLYTDGERLFAVCFENERKTGGRSGCAITVDGDQWTDWNPFSGANGYVLWRPVFQEGKHFCAGYQSAGKEPAIHWFESADGQNWERCHKIHDSENDLPSECFLEFQKDGSALMIIRREKPPKHPLLARSKPPFDTWDLQILDDLQLTGPSLWTADNHIYIAGRWHPNGPKAFGEGGYSAHTAIFRVHEGETALQCVLPSGPHPDHSYLGVARHPEDPNRFSLSFYGNAVAPTDPAVNQWNHPDVYLAEVVCGKDLNELKP
ncbi:MAG: sialidase family protein [Candidatus Latescibacterota bacterium]|nr:sialidase family protein [Candidatus Latescibacterota bacterium]